MWSVPALSRSLLFPSSGQKMEGNWFLVNGSDTYQTLLLLLLLIIITIIIIIIIISSTIPILN